MSMTTWFRTARQPDIVARSTKVALIIGTILAVINQGDVLLDGAPGAMTIVKIVMTYCVPYAVSTYASVEAVRNET